MSKKFNVKVWKNSLGPFKDMKKSNNNEWQHITTLYVIKSVKKSAMRNAES